MNLWVVGYQGKYTGTIYTHLVTTEDRAIDHVLACDPDLYDHYTVTKWDLRDYGDGEKYIWPSFD